MNLHEVPVVDGRATFAGCEVPIPRGTANGRVVLGFRPESLELVGDSEPGVQVTVLTVEELGSDAYVYGSLGEADLVAGPDVIARIDPAAVPRAGSRINLRIKPNHIHLFSADTGRRIEAA